MCWEWSGGRKVSFGIMLVGRRGQDICREGCMSGEACGWWWKGQDRTGYKQCGVHAVRFLLLVVDRTGQDISSVVCIL